MTRNTQPPFRVSPSSLAPLIGAESCRQCLWFDTHSAEDRPTGPIPSFFTAMDHCTKKRWDNSRRRGTVPPELAEALDADANPTLLSQHEVDKIRHWRTCPRWTGKGVEGIDGIVKLSGGLDDAFWTSAGTRRVFYPVDYKTRGQVPDTASISEYYVTQLESYMLLLEAYLEEEVDDEKAVVADRGYLVVYADPSFRAPETTRVDFEAEAVPVDLDREHIIELLREAGDVLRSAEPPEASSTCRHCAWTSLVAQGTLNDTEVE